MQVEINISFSLLLLNSELTLYQMTRTLIIYLKCTCGVCSWEAPPSTSSLSIQPSNNWIWTYRARAGNGTPQLEMKMRKFYGSTVEWSGVVVSAYPLQSRQNKFIWIEIGEVCNIRYDEWKCLHSAINPFSIAIIFIEKNKLFPHSRLSSSINRVRLCKMV